MLHGDGMPWYPSARLYRQRATESWAPVIQAVGSELSRLPAPA
jgi:hypothetical protein